MTTSQPGRPVTEPDTKRDRRAPTSEVTSRRGGLIVVVLIGLVAFLVPSGYAFTQSWEASANARRTSTTELAGVAYLSSLSNLLAALVDAEAASARGVAVAEAGIREAIDEVNRVDQLYGDELLARQRWSAVPEQIDVALKAAPQGAEALDVYAIPIGLTRTLLAAVGSTSLAVRDPEPAAAELVDAHISKVSEIMVQAGALVALARSQPAQSSGVAVARDRIAAAAESLGAQLRLVSVGPGATDLLAQVDQLVAAVVGITQTSTTTDLLSSATTLSRIDEAYAVVHQAAANLGATLLSIFDGVLSARAAALDRERVVLIAGAALQGGGAVLLFLAFLAVARRPRRVRVTAPADSTSRVMSPATNDQPAGPAHTGQLASANVVKPLSTAGQGPAARWE